MTINELVEGESEQISNKPNCWYDGEAIYKSSFDKQHGCFYCLTEDEDCLYAGGRLRLNFICDYKGGFKE